MVERFLRHHDNNEPQPSLSIPSIDNSTIYKTTQDSILTPISKSNQIYAEIKEKKVEKKVEKKIKVKRRDKNIKKI
jgi:hypothetical protein